MQPLPSSTVSETEARLLKQEVANRLAEHRSRRPQRQDALAQTALPLEQEALAAGRRRGGSVADSVAARFARSTSYRDFLQQEAEAAMRQAEAAAEVARRNAEAIVAAQQQLLDEIDHWNEPAQETAAEPAPVLAFVAPEQKTSIPAIVEEEQFLFSSSAEIADASVKHRTVEHRTEPAAASPLPEAPPETVVRPTIAEMLRQASPEPAEPPVPIHANLIEFPRQLVAARRARPRHALGPLLEEANAAAAQGRDAQLRIFEVEASSISTVPAVEGVLPEWSTIRLDAAPAERAYLPAEEQISFAPPIYSASIGRRVMAATVDACCIGTAFVLSVAAAAMVSPAMPAGKLAAMSAGGVLFGIAMLYPALFFTFSDATPGMRYARIGLCTFGDDNPSRAAIRRRALVTMLSIFPLGLGILWALLDENALGWHDRISRIYQRAY